MFRSVIAAPVAICLAALPLAAQDTPVEAPKASFTAEDDLDCALFLSAVLGSLGANASPEETSGLISGVTYFVGRYEALVNEDIDTAMPARYPVFIQQGPAAYQAVCSERMAAVGIRMEVAGAAITAIESEQSEAEGQAPPSGD